MKNPEKEVERLRREPIETSVGSISVIETGDIISVELRLLPCPEISHLGSAHLFSPEEWVRVISLMHKYVKKEIDNYLK